MFQGFVVLSVCPPLCPFVGQIDEETLATMLALQNQQQTVGTPFGMAMVDPEDM